MRSATSIGSLLKVALERAPKNLHTATDRMSILTFSNAVCFGVMHSGHLGSELTRRLVCLLVGCLTSQQHASVSQGRICSDNFTCCHTEIEAANQTFHLTQSQYTDTGPTSPSADPITPGSWQGSHWSASV